MPSLGDVKTGLRNKARLTSSTVEGKFNASPFVNTARQSNFAFKGSAWFTLALLVAYIVYVPIHVATEAHCLPGAACVHEGDCGHGADHDHGHGHHHSADEHDLNATGKHDTQLSVVFLATDAVMVVPKPAGVFQLVAEDLEPVPDRASDRSLQPRAPPLA